MAAFKTLFFFCLILVVSCFAEQEGPFLLVRKTILHEEIVTGRDLVVNIEIFNVGKGPAYDVRIDDEACWPSTRFSKVIGLTTGSWDRIASGSNVSHTLIVKADFVGPFPVEPAVVQYRQTPRGELQLGYSSSPGTLEVLPRSEIERRQAPHLKEWGVFLILSAIAVAPSYFIWSNFQQNYKHGVKKN